MTLFLTAVLTFLPVLAWGSDLTSDQRICQAQTASLTIQLRESQQARTAYVAKLAEILAETREQLDQARAQLQALSQEVARLKAAKPEEKLK